MVKFINCQQNVEKQPCRIVLLDKKEWLQMHDRIGEGLRQEEEREKLAARKNAKLQMSKNIAANWPNTLVNKQKEREERIVRALEQLEENNIKEYKRIKQEHAQERAKEVEKAKKIIFERSQNCRTITSGVILSEVVHERQKQVDIFYEKLRKLDCAEREETQRRRKLAEEFRLELEKEKIKHVESQKMNKLELDAQVEDQYNRKQYERDEKQREKEDMEHIRKSLAEEEIALKKQADERREKVKEEGERWKAVVKEYEDKRLEQEREEKELNEIYQTVKERLDEQRKIAEKKFRDDQISKRAKFASMKNPPPPDTSMEELKRQMQLLQQRYNEEMKADEEEKRRKKELLKEELMKIRIEALQAAREAEERDREVLRYEKLQRIALEDANRKWNEEQELIRRNRQKVTWQALVNQWQERLEKDERSKMDTTEILKAQTTADETLLRYCEEVENLAKMKGKPLYPIQSAIKAVLKSQGIPEKKHVPFLQSRVPIASVGVYENEQLRGGRNSCKCD